MIVPPQVNATRPVALQLWTVREALARDVDVTLRRVKAAGFSTVEVAPTPPGLEPERLAEGLERLGLGVVSVHGDLLTPANVESWIHLVRVYRCPKVIWHGWPRDPRFDSLGGVRDLVADCNEAAAVALDRGLRFGLHNHWWEFEAVEGERPIRLLHELLNPEVFWQLDVYWAQTAGADPAEAARALGPRLGSVHWKDGPAVRDAPMTPLGQGSVDIPAILRAVDRQVGAIIELDECATEPLAAARESRDYLESVRDEVWGG